MSISRSAFIKMVGASALGVAIAPNLTALTGRSHWGTLAGNAMDSTKGGNRIALTFDDGPTPLVTKAVVDELNKRNLRATFFMIGQRVVLEPELAQMVHAGNHEIGNHGFTHSALMTTLPKEQIAWEIQKTQEMIVQTTGFQPVWFRPTEGALHDVHAPIPQQQGLKVALWNVDAGDCAPMEEPKIVDNVLSQTRGGSIVRCHDLHEQTGKCIGQVLDGLLERGFQCVTVSELIQSPTC